MTGKLTSPEIRAALRKGDHIILSDGGGITLEVRRENFGSWIYRGRVRGTKQIVKVTLGNAPEMGLSQAREAAMKAKLEMKQGINPNEEKRKRLEEAAAKEQAQKLTFKHVALEWFNTQTTNTVDKTRDGIRRRLEIHVFPFIGNTPFADIQFSSFKNIG